MKKTVSLKITIALVFSLCFGLITFNHLVAAQQPSYGKWGKVAIEKVKEAYPGGDVSDFLFVGSKNISEEETTDTFLFVVKTNNKGIEVRVKISFNPKNDQFISSDVQEIK